MELATVEKIEYYYVTIKGSIGESYKRCVNGDGDCWEVLIGESWESFYDSKELEEALQKHLNKNPPSPLTTLN